uniref:ABC transporter B family member 9-like n=1 Tax=Rhizophora mucronata TaxID=61149 RepID=A0A2P2KRV1_RHIMU
MYISKFNFTMLLFQYHSICVIGINPWFLLDCLKHLVHHSLPSCKCIQELRCLIQ